MSHYSKRASNPSKSSGKAEIVLDLPTVCKMLPLVRQIVVELLEAEQTHGNLLSERAKLDHDRLKLSWPERKRRYDVQDDIDRVEQTRRALTHELEQLGVQVIDPTHGRVGFPTIVNAKPAFFSWQLGEDEVSYWHFAGDSDRRRAIPPNWKLDVPLAATKRK
jgi:hypothetical protein